MVRLIGGLWVEIEHFYGFNMATKWPHPKKVEGTNMGAGSLAGPSSSNFSNKIVAV
jgi:hypothetical protein